MSGQNIVAEIKASVNRAQLWSLLGSVLVLLVILGVVVRGQAALKVMKTGTR